MMFIGCPYHGYPQLKVPQFPFFITLALLTLFTTYSLGGGLACSSKGGLEFHPIGSTLPYEEDACKSQVKPT
jgi:hypothetical protein